MIGFMLLRGEEHKLAVRLMKEAMLEVGRATCGEARRGVVLARDTEILGRGYNGPMPGYWCDTAICGSRCTWYFPKAEERAIDDARKRGHSLADAIAYCAELKNGSRHFTPGLTSLQGMLYLSKFGITGFVFYAEDSRKQERLELYTPYDINIIAQERISQEQAL